jgi:hypothetical protein
MDLSNFTRGRGLRLGARGQRKNCDVRVRLQHLLNGRNRCIDFRRSLAARMVSGFAMAITSHLLTAVHFRLGHLAVWQTGERRRDRPQNHQTHDKNGSDSRHS